jgi:hypothetical protein
MLLRSAVLAMLTSLIPSVALADPPIRDRALHQWFVFAGMRTQIDAIQSVASVDSNPILKSVSGQDDDKGYLIVTIEYQNPTSGEDRDIADVFFNFELLDGSKLDSSSSSVYGPFNANSGADGPRTLHPKQHVTVRYVVTNWPGTQITKMFFVVNGGNSGSNSTGDQNDRFAITKDDVTSLAPSGRPGS